MFAVRSLRLASNAAAGTRSSLVVHCNASIASSTRAMLLSTTSLPRRTYPQYTVYGTNCLLALKIVMPSFKVSKQQALYVDGSKGMGRVVLEWTPRDASGRGDYDRTVRFGLSPEELGVVADQSPHHSVEFLRRLQTDDGVMDAASNKLVRIAPPMSDNNGSGRGSMYSFVFDYERDGVTGVGPEGPYEVQVQLGEFKVLHELMRTSIPVITGWSALVDYGLQAAVEQAMNEGGAGGSGGQYQDYRGNVPF